MLFLSPPFGNYIRLPDSLSIKGSYILCFHAQDYFRKY